ncbi:UDP-N-acetylmuramoyl-L-alanyl-D-glutamate--2,6-diaminopimelate ligase [Oceanospirillum maris]|uniref:UDP-N-acetylmuramoyl-L-alanyl-D-glutamate--2, 6-diaminopimelate ligase n=1 Tax=Oceanospirillum maris TaxID=64977 RepID=UPI00040BBAF4|nr:UDP-N-acetylmuramoyl-L-alanyl-D-glutamate--2,6-diaminopimelate ligase [Oceanospirillum maris]
MLANNFIPTDNRFVPYLQQKLVVLFPELLPEFFSDRSTTPALTGLLRIDSRQIERHDIFVALNGTQHKGRDFIPSAIEKGAGLVLLESDVDTLYWVESIPIVALKDLRHRLGAWLAAAGELNTGSPHLIGITGTNGKTSVSHYLAQLLEMLGEKAAVIGTVGIGALNDLKTATHTTPDLIQLHQVLATLKRQDFNYQVMEVSSHALDQKRTAGVPFEVGIFTNLSRDHLDYHGTMAAYGAAKSALFTQYPLSVALLNADDAYYPELKATIASNNTDVRLLSYSLDKTDADLYCETLLAHPQGFQLTLNGRWGSFDVSLPLLGDFNVANALAATAVLFALGFKPDQVVAQLRQIKPVAGRMQLVSINEALSGDNCKDSNVNRLPKVVVDYAHTPDALENALLAVGGHIQGCLWCVFGCGGDRDAGKRPLMAEVASRLSDNVIVTSDNPRSENPADIVFQVEAGLIKPATLVDVDRQRAIEQAILRADTDDVILIAGKGHETYQEIQGVRHYFDDVDVAQAALRLRGHQALVSQTTASSLTPAEGTSL